MKKIISPLFAGLTDAEYEAMMGCNFFSTKKYRKGEPILLTGDVTRNLCVVISGGVNIENIDLWGNRSILSNVGAGQIFAETYAITGEVLMVDAVATEDCEVLFVNAAGLISCRRDSCAPAPIKGGSNAASACPNAAACSNANASWHSKVIGNLLMISSRKNLTLSSRIFQTSFKTIRPRVESYLTAVSLKTGSTEFDIPFDRQELADYLNLDRSALSKELMHMRDEGLIEFKKNHFKIKGIFKGEGRSQ